MDLTRLPSQELIKHIPTKEVQSEWQNRGIFPANLVYIASPKEAKRFINFLQNYHNLHGDKKTRIANMIYDFLYEISNEKPYVAIGDDVYNLEGINVGDSKNIKKLHRTTSFESYVGELLASI